MHYRDALGADENREKTKKLEKIIVDNATKIDAEEDMNELLTPMWTSLEKFTRENECSLVSATPSHQTTGTNTIGCFPCNFFTRNGL